MLAQIGLGAVKFADLAMTRTNDYKFSFKKMLAFQGMSAPFMIYQFVRIKSIVRKFGGAGRTHKNPSPSCS